MSWKIYLYLLDKLNLSSSKPTMPKGKKINRLKFLNIMAPIPPEIKNTSPPPVGFGSKWELLWSGRSNKNLLKKGSNLLKINKVHINDMIP